MKLVIGAILDGRIVAVKHHLMETVSANGSRYSSATSASASAEATVTTAAAAATTTAPSCVYSGNVSI